jgi:hypothetical protein
MPPSRLTFQVAIFGPPGAGKTSTLSGLHRILPSERLGALVEIPAFSPYVGTVMFFDYRPAEFTKPSVTFRFRTVSGNDQEGFATLFGADALIFVADCRPSKREANHEALSRAMEHFRTYPPSWASIPKVAQLTHVDELGSDLPSITSILKIDELPCVKTDPSSGDGLRPLAEAIMSEVLAAFRDGRVAGKPTRRLSKKYLARANALAAAADIAAAVSPTGAEVFETATKLMALHPELGFESLESLAFLESDFFTYWNEGTEPHVDEFWKLVAQHGLPYKRRDPLRDIIRRGRIRSGVEYEVATDGIDDERLREREREQLEAMLAAYEGLNSIE